MDFTAIYKPATARMEADMEAIIRSLRLRPALPAWKNVGLSRDWMVRFPAPATSLGEGACSCGGEGALLIAEFQPHPKALQSPAEVFKLQSELIRRIRPDLESSGFTIHSERALPPSVEPQGFAIAFESTYRGESKRVYRLTKATTAGRIQLTAVVDSGTPRARTLGRAFLHQLRLVHPAP